MCNEFIFGFKSVPLYFSSLSLLRTALHYLNAWNWLLLIVVSTTAQPGYPFFMLGSPT